MKFFFKNYWMQVIALCAAFFVAAQALGLTFHLVINGQLLV